MSDYISTSPVMESMRTEDTSFRRHRLVLSDYLMLAAFAVALFIEVDPFGLDFERPAITKHLPLFVATGALMLGMIGHALRSALNPDRLGPSSLVRVGYPLAILGTWIFIGSTYARLVDHIQDTFLTMGLYMLATFGIALSVRLCDDHARFIALLCRMIAATSAFMIVRMFAIHDFNGGIYHEMEFLVIPVAVYFALRPSGSRVGRICKTSFFLLGGAIFLKNTAFIVMGITTLYLWHASWRFYFKETLRMYRMIVVVAIGLLCAGAAALQFSHAFTEVSMPSGNPGYRVRTYERAIAQFEASPAWGTLFAARSTVRFTAFQIDEAGGQLPTHSDILDLAAHGGIVALGLLVWVYVRIGREIHGTLLRERRITETGATAHMLACICLSGIADYAFNPIMLQPDKALLLWGALGILLGCCEHRTNSLHLDRRLSNE